MSAEFEFTPRESVNGTGFTTRIVAQGRTEESFKLPIGRLYGIGICSDRYEENVGRTYVDLSSAPVKASFTGRRKVTFYPNEMQVEAIENLYNKMADTFVDFLSVQDDPEVRRYLGAVGVMNLKRMIKSPIYVSKDTKRMDCYISPETELKIRGTRATVEDMVYRKFYSELRAFAPKLTLTFNKEDGRPNHVNFRFEMCELDMYPSAVSRSKGADPIELSM